MQSSPFGVAMKNLFCLHDKTGFFNAARSWRVTVSSGLPGKNSFLFHKARFFRTMVEKFTNVYYTELDSCVCFLGQKTALFLKLYWKTQEIMI